MIRSPRSGAALTFVTGLVTGLWLGVVDGAITLHATPELAGPWADRLATVAVAMTFDALLLALVGGIVGFARSRTSRTTDRSRRSGSLRRAPLATAAGVAVLAAFAAASFGFGNADGSGGVRGDARPNVLLLSIDTLRADALGSYGNTPSPSPRLDALARQGVLFEDAYSSASWTLPAHVSVLTGLDPFAHGVLSEDDRLGPEFATLTEQLHDAGYWTGAWVGTPPFGFVGARYGLDQGFDLYRHEPHPDRLDAAFLVRAVRSWAGGDARGRLGSGAHLTDSVIAWLGGRRREPFFLFVHFYDVHSKFEGLPYEAPQPYRERFCPDAIAGYDGCRDGLCASDRLHAIATGDAPRPDASELERMRCLYEGGIAFVDHQVGRILDALESEGVAGNTLVVVTSDHGEAFFEHGTPLHVTLHEEILRVPLIVRVPRGAGGKRVRGAVRLIDLAPTILDFVGIAPAGPVLGESLLGVLRSWPTEPQPRPVLAAAYRSSSVALIEDGTKTIHNGDDRRRQGAPAIERYDLGSDPDEQWNRAASTGPDLRDETLERLRAASEAIHHKVVDRRSRESVVLSEEERKHLRALGYLEEPEGRDDFEED